MSPLDVKVEKQELVSDAAVSDAGINRRHFLRYSVSAVAGYSFVPWVAGCGGSDSWPSYLIDAAKVGTTVDRMLAFDKKKRITDPKSKEGLHPLKLSQVQDYDKFGYGQYRYGKGLAIEPRFDLLGDSGSRPLPTKTRKLASFFATTDVHMTDKEAPNQLIYIQQADSAYGAAMTSIYSPVILYTMQMLDAAIQTVNALHKKSPFDFGISLGDVCDSGRYNELRWYIDVLDGKPIRPSSGAHLGEDSVDFQKPFQAVGLDKSIPWYQTLGNHDHFYIGSVPVDAFPSLRLRESYVSAKVWAVGDVLLPNAAKVTPAAFPPVVYDMPSHLSGTSPVTLNDPVSGVAGNTFYMGVIDGASPYGAIKYTGNKEDFDSAPTVAADPNRRALLRSEWIAEFFNTTSLPKGHGFDRVPEALRRSEDGFACYSFVPKAGVPLKVIVLDNTQREDDGSHDIHGHGFLDAARWKWLQEELDAGQAANQLMVIAAHIPIGVSAPGSLMEWWNPKGQATAMQNDPHAVMDNACTLAELVRKLQDTPNLLMWMSGHRHLNTIKAFPAYGEGGKLVPEKSFWQVETSSLVHFPQQFRTFDIYLNSDDTVSVVAVNVDPEVAEGSPAATSRKYAIAEQQILHSDLRGNELNEQLLYGKFKVDSLDPTRPQDGTEDPSIRYGNVEGVDYCASYNAELFKKLTPTMADVLRRLA